MSSADEQVDQLTALIERLVVDPSFRGEFRRDPIELSQAYGLGELAEEFRAQGNGIHTLELRESKSSLAGVVMAIAAEGIGLAEVRGMLGHGPGHAAALKALKGAGVKTPSGGAAGLAKAAGLHGVPGAGAHGKGGRSVAAARGRYGSGAACWRCPARYGSGAACWRCPGCFGCPCRCGSRGFPGCPGCCGCPGAARCGGSHPGLAGSGGRSVRRRGPSVFHRRRRRRVCGGRCPTNRRRWRKSGVPVGRGARGARTGDPRRRGGCSGRRGDARRWLHRRFCRSTARQPEPVGAGFGARAARLGRR